MSMPVGAAAAAPSCKRKAEDPVDPSLLDTAQKAESAYLDQLQVYGVGSPLKKPNGKPCQGTYKTARKTSDPQKVAIMASPHRAPQPRLYASVAEREKTIYDEVEDGPHIPKCYDQFSVPDRRYTSIQENVGEDLHAAYIDPANPARRVLHLHKLERICRQLLEATLHLHQKGILHGDIKPENASATGYLLDFGMSEKIGDTYTNALKYSPYYRPPETTFGAGTRLSSDVWALGCLFFELYMKQPLIPVPDQYDSDAIGQSTVNRIHALQDRLGIKFDLDRLQKVRPETVAVDANGNMSLKPFTLRYPLRTFREEILSAPNGARFESFADLLTKMLNVNFNERITVAEALTHPFFTSAESCDSSFKLAITGNKQMGIRIFNWRDELVDTIDLSIWRPSTCYHIYKSSKPHRLQFFNLAKPDETVHECPLSFDLDRETISIDTDTFSILPKQFKCSRKL